MTGRLAIKHVDRVLAAMDAEDDLETLPWRRSTLDDRRELLAVRSAGVCLLRDLDLGRKPHPALIAAIRDDAVIAEIMRERGLLV